MENRNEAVLDLARDALRAAEREVPRFSHVRSPRTYTQHQLFALIAVRRYLRVDFRALTTLAAQWPELRGALALARTPHYSTLCYAERRLLGEGGHGPLLAAVLGRAHLAAEAAGAPPEAPPGDSSREGFLEAIPVAATASADEAAPEAAVGAAPTGEGNFVSRPATTRRVGVS